MEEPMVLNRNIVKWSVSIGETRDGFSFICSKRRSILNPLPSSRFFAVILPFRNILGTVRSLMAENLCDFTPVKKFSYRQRRISRKFCETSSHCQICADLNDS